MAGVYRPPATPPRGEWARFLHRQRQARDWSQQRAFEELRAGLKLGTKSRSAYIAIDMGQRQPTADEKAYLVSKFGEEPNDADRTEYVPVGETDFAATLQALTEELGAMRQERLALWRGIAVALRSPAGARVAAVLSDALAPLLPESAAQ